MNTKLEDPGPPPPFAKFSVPLIPNSQGINQICKIGPYALHLPDIPWWNLSTGDYFKIIQAPGHLEIVPLWLSFYISLIILYSLSDYLSTYLLLYCTLSDCLSTCLLLYTVLSLTVFLHISYYTVLPVTVFLHISYYTVLSLNLHSFELSL